MSIQATNIPDYKSALQEMAEHQNSENEQQIAENSSLSLRTQLALSLPLLHHLPPPSPPSDVYTPPENPKPWPILPSYLHWPLKPNTPFRSCEAYFGNGYTQGVNPLKPVSEPRRKIVPGGAGGGWFRCFYSAALRSSVCEGGGGGIRMNPERILMSKGGGGRLEGVIGRGEDEDEELPNFEIGAFEIESEGGFRIGEKMVDDEFLDKYIEA